MITPNKTLKFSSIRKTTRMSIHIYELSEVMVKLKANQVVGRKKNQQAIQTKGALINSNSNEILTTTMSPSDQGMWSPPVKKLPTDSKNVPIFASISQRISNRGRRAEEERFVLRSNESERRRNSSIMVCLEDETQIGLVWDARKTKLFFPLKIKI